MHAFGNLWLAFDAVITRTWEGTVMPMRSHANEYRQLLQCLLHGLGQTNFQVTNYLFTPVWRSHEAQLSAWHMCRWKYAGGSVNAARFVNVAVNSLLHLLACMRQGMPVHSGMLP